MSNYLRWNDALAVKFFNEDASGRNVNLYVNQQLIEDMERADKDLGSFRSTIIESIDTEQRGGSICKVAYELYLNWRAKSYEYPPYIGYLSFFVLAGDTTGDFAPNAYHPKLWELLSEDPHGSVPYFDRMRFLWHDLETWSHIDTQGQYGEFSAYSIGGYRHVGYPLAQSLLDEKERAALPEVFLSRSLEPGCEYPADELARALRGTLAKSVLRGKTYRLINNRLHDDLYYALLRVVADELNDWDGLYVSRSLGKSTLSEFRGGLRICIDYDQVSEVITSSLRCRISENTEFPDDGLFFDDGKLEARDAGFGWSLPITNRQTGEVLEASVYDWSIAEQKSDPDRRFVCEMRGSPVRVFTSGLRIGHSGYVESYGLPRDESFYIACREDKWPLIKRWGETGCRGFHERSINQGLPVGWRFATVELALSDEDIKDEIRALSFVYGASIRLIGGIRSGSRNSYFNFARPLVSVNTDTAETHIYCNDVEISKEGQGQFYLLPTKLETESGITLEVRTESGARIDRHTIFLTGDFNVKQIEPMCFGEMSDEVLASKINESIISGAFISGITSDALLTEDVFIDWSSEMNITNAFVIGQYPGQIAKWPMEQFPMDWVPQWVIKKERKKLSAIYVGGLFERIDLAEIEDISRRDVKRWHEVLWRRRKRVKPPEDTTQHEIWLKLQETSRFV